MADGDDKAADEEEARRRALRPRATIDLAALEPGDPAVEPPPVTGGEPPAPPRASPAGYIVAALAGAILAIAAIYALALTGWLPAAQDETTRAAIAGLKDEVAAVQQRAAAPPPQSVDETARQEVAKVRAAEVELGGRVDRLAQSLKAADDALAGKADRAAVAKLAQAPATATAVDADLARRVGAAETALGAKATQSDLKALADRLGALQSSVATLRASDPGRAAGEARAAASVAAIAALDGALARGTPYRDYLSDIRHLVGDADLKPLERYADQGAPPLRALASRLAADLAAAPAPAPPTDAGFLDRLYASLRGLVRVTRVTTAGEPTGTSEDARRGRVIARLDRGDYRGAIAAWQSLEPAARQATAEAEAALAARLDAETRLTELGRRALAALGGAADEPPR